MKIAISLTVLIIVGIFSQLLVIFPSGSRYCFLDTCGTYFWGANEHDAVWHLAVAERSFVNTPYEMPNMSGAQLSGYNYLLDLVMHNIRGVTGIPLDLLYFKIIPVLWIGLFVYLTLRFARGYSNSKIYPIILLFFNFFGSSFAYLLTLKNRGSIWGSSGLLAMQSGQNLLNVQFAISLLPLLTVLIGLTSNKRKIQDYILYSTCLVLAFGFKFYTGTAILCLLLVDFAIIFFKQYSNIIRLFPRLLVVIASTLVSLWLFYKPTGLVQGWPLIFKPLATVNPIIEDSSLLYLTAFAERLYSYHGVKLLLLELFVLSIFIFFNYGTRFLSLGGYLVRTATPLNPIRKTITISSFTLLGLSIFFVQRGVWWNTVQFLYVSLFLANVLAAEGVTRLIEYKRVWSRSLAVGIILLTIPTNLDIVRIFGSVPGTSYISDSEMAALNFLGTQQSGIVLTDVYKSDAPPSAARQLPLSYDTSYITAYSGQQTYLSDTIQLTLTGVEHAERLAKLASYNCENLEKVTYLYELVARPYKNNYDICGFSLERIFENAVVSLYLVK